VVRRTLANLKKREEARLLSEIGDSPDSALEHAQSYLFSLPDYDRLSYLTRLRRLRNYLRGCVNYATKIERFSNRFFCEKAFRR